MAHRTTAPLRLGIATQWRTEHRRMDPSRSAMALPAKPAQTSLCLRLNPASSLSIGALLRRSLPSLAVLAAFASHGGGAGSESGPAGLPFPVMMPDLAIHPRMHICSPTNSWYCSTTRTGVLTAFDPDFASVSAMAFPVLCLKHRSLSFPCECTCKVLILNELWPKKNKLLPAY